MRAVNIYAISRIREEAPFNIVEKHQAQRETVADIRFHEIESLRNLVDGLVGEGVTVSQLDGFFYGFQIPQIGKEFDLLKMLENACINIELKSTAVPKQQIVSQLRKNRHYLNHLGRKLHLYTVVTDSLTCYRLSDKDELVEAEMSQLAALVQENARDYIPVIDQMFRAADYLVSPFQTPEKFIRGEYFLTQAQEQIKKKLLQSAQRTPGVCFHLTGRPGTGKTLLLYDLAKTFAEMGRTLLVHCDRLCEGLEKINREIPGLRIVPAQQLKTGGQYDYILVDEAHRIYEDQLENIFASAAEHNQTCVFSSDPEQVLTRAEKERNIVEKIRSRGAEEFVLSEKLRANPALHAFIRQMRNLGHTPQKAMDYSGVFLNYANTTGEAQSLLDYYRSKGFVFINYTRPEYSQNPYAQFEGGLDTHHVIGREYDKVVMVLDDSFFYDEAGILQGVPHPDPDYLYPNLFYQGITRVREELAIVVVSAPDLFHKIANIVK